MMEIERLRRYFAFDDDVLMRVSKVAEVQRAKSWETFQRELPKPQIFKPKRGKSIEVVEFGPKEDYDDVQVYHLAMSCRLDPNILMCMAVLAAAEPRTRIITVGNLGGTAHRTGALRWRDMPGVWRGNLDATVRPTLEYMQGQGITEATHIGYSFGADKAAAAIGLATAYGQTVTRAIFMDPAAVTRRSLGSLVRAFDEAGEVMEDYVQAAALPAYNEARDITKKLEFGYATYVAGLLRPTNVAIAEALARDGFEARVANALKSQSNLQVAVVWGSASELAHHGLMTKLTAHLAKTFGEKRVRTLTIQNQRHAMGSDLFLHDAIILQSLKND